MLQEGDALLTGGWLAAGGASVPDRGLVVQVPASSLGGGCGQPAWGLAVLSAPWGHDGSRDQDLLWGVPGGRS